MTSRRGFLGACLALAAAPAIVRADSLMRVVPFDLVLVERGVTYRWLTYDEDPWAKAVKKVIGTDFGGLGGDATVLAERYFGTIERFTIIPSEIQLVVAYERAGEVVAKLRGLETRGLG
jgi:hypothetical protein